ncbi:hypothetical protein E4T56_gene14194 [Termitomyces sp. T112]|nr:hypothetical protein E4T56_gene14194 [Termitomyces sp. T112]KAH0585177.1 hypothetical protein H2248_008433 [Termitomyces sp. 'cryptogamus']
MPTQSTNIQNNHLNIPSDALRKSCNKVNDSPVTPAVTGIIYPSTPLDSNTEAETSVYRPPVNHFYKHPNVAASNIDDPLPRPLSEGHSLDKLWSTIRQQKERKMAKEKPKVQSLEERANDLSWSDPLPVDIPVLESNVPDPKTLKKRKSISSYRESSDGRTMVVTFDLDNVAKQDVHVSFQRNRLIITWATAEINEWEDKGVIYRERLERHHHRTLPLAEGTKFEEIRGIMSERQLILRYPLARCVRVESRSRSGDS